MSSRPRDRILANLESIYRDAYDRAEKAGDKQRMLDLDAYISASNGVTLSPLGRGVRGEGGQGRLPPRHVHRPQRALHIQDQFGRRGVVVR